MKIYKNLEQKESKNTPSALIIGNFDGVHRGHQMIVDKAKKIATENNLAVGLLTFEPHPRELFRQDDSPFRITPEDIKLDRLAKTGLDVVWSLPFDWDFAGQSAEAFIENVIIKGIRAGHVIVGFDFRFGQLRRGSPDTLKDAGLDVTVIDEITDQQGEKFSSSTIRQCLRHGKITEANEMLGWDWYVEGVVTKGDQRGRELGYPTANIALDRTIHPAYGIYASRVQIEGEDQWRPAVTNIGIRPMFKVPVAQVETFLFDFDQEIYGKTIRVRPVERLRGEAKFDSLNNLIEQMNKDCEQAKRILEE